MYWANLDSTKIAAWAAPYNNGNPNDIYVCYNGGSWNRGDSTMDYHFTVSGYDLNFLPSGLKFPTHKAGNSGASTGYDTYIGCFSAGYVQVLNVFPRYQNATLNMETGITVKILLQQRWMAGVFRRPGTIRQAMPMRQIPGTMG